MIPQEEGFNRRAHFFKSLHSDSQQACHNHQTHTKIVHTVSGEPLKGREGDGFVTKEPRWILTATAADCMPIYLVDPVRKIRGLVHSGWAGTGISLAALEKMIELGSRKEDIFAVMGPSIGTCCYQVDGERWKLFRNLWGEEAVAGGDDQGSLNLRGANLSLLEKAGIPRVYDLDICTCCNDSYGSFRRERDEYTRMMAYLGGF